MDLRSILRTKRDGGELDEEAIRFFLTGYVDGSIPDHAASSLLTSIFIHGMAGDELVAWTRAMLESGTRFDWSDLARPKVDKHSTGGVGDKVSLPLAAALAACDVVVPMISGRGLGHTGGTLDKLESIPGLRTELSTERFARTLEEVGCVIAAQTQDLVPADRKLYALRDATGLIESIPLIASSILSKKLAEGLDALVLDIKFGSGSFLPAPEQGAELARTMLEIARGMGLSTVCFQTAMDRPLGFKIGNALEVLEAVDCLRGAGPADLRELVCTLGGSLLRQVGVAPDEFAGRTRIAHVLDDGSGFTTFQRMVEAQGGDPRCLEAVDGLDVGPDREPFRASCAGFLGYADVQELGRAVVELGGGRKGLGDAVDPGVGLELLVRPGEQVSEGQELILVHHRGGRGLDEVHARLTRGVIVGPKSLGGGDADGSGQSTPLVLARIDP